MTEGSVAQAAAPKKPKLMLTDIERVVFDRCRVTGDTPDEAVKHDPDLIRALLKEALKNTRKDRIQARLDNDLEWCKQQIAKLKVGVRDRKDEPNGTCGADVKSSELQDEAVRRMQSGADELHGAPDA